MERVFIRDYLSCQVMLELESVEEAFKYFGIEMPESIEWECLGSSKRLMIADRGIIVVVMW